MKKYGILQNVFYMIKEAWEVRKNLLLLFVVISIFAKVGLAIVELFITPEIVKMIQLKQDFRLIVIYIICIVGIYFIFEAIREVVLQFIITPKIDVRTNLIFKILKRNLTMPYQLTLNSKLKQNFKRCQELTSSNHTFSELIFDSIINFVSNFIMLVIYIKLLSVLPIFLIIFTVISSILSFYIGKKIKDWRFNHSEQENEFFGKTYYLYEKSSNITSEKDIKMFGLKSWFDDIFNSVIFSYDSFLRKASNKEFLSGLLAAIIDLFRNGITYYYLINLVFNKQIDVAGFILLFSAQGNFSKNILDVFNEMYNFVKYSNDANIIRSFLEYEDPYNLDDGIEINNFDVNNINIELKNVYFKYPEADEYILEDINMKIKPRDKIAIVGMNGSGKTTLIKIIIGFLDPTKGEVLLNGKNIKQYRRRDYYKIFSAVFQDYSIIPDKLKYNITQDFKDNNIEKINKIIELSGLKEKVDSLEKGIDTVLMKHVYEEGQELSGGEIQKLLLARALYRNSPFLILDEPTAALDPIAERDLYNKYNQLTSSATSIFISHRMASTRFCDYILLVKDKKILEKGTHDELINLGGEYKYLFDVQSKYYREGENV
ncbi:ABC transporter ATP-binding protein [Helcococcus ovis]|uniref:ABC transporter ATP-binding protein n=1 Tax=Helcococcus ovis TaxID=72026 RepID=UPI0038BAAB4D